MLKSQRLIVSDVPGTTRDAVELDLGYQKSSNEVLKFRLADTAGLRSKRKVDSSVEYFSSMRTQHALERSDVVFLVIDAMEGVTKQDQALAGAIQDAGKSMVVVVNKWDLVLQQWEQQPVDGFKNVQQFAQAYEKSLRKQFFFLPNPAVLFCVCLSGFQVESLLEEAAQVAGLLDVQLPTGRLNRLIERLFEARSPKIVGTKRFKVFMQYKQGISPFVFAFCNRIERLDPSYRRYLEKAILHEFALRGCTIRFDLIGKERRYEESFIGRTAANGCGTGASSGAQNRRSSARKRYQASERRAKIVQRRRLTIARSS